MTTKINFFQARQFFERVFYFLSDAVATVSYTVVILLEAP